MFCITLQWGLWNQLFQYAFWQVLAKQYNTTVTYDTGIYHTWSLFSLACFLGVFTPRSLQLSRFAITLDHPTLFQRRKLWMTGIHKILKLIGIKNRHMYDEKPWFTYDDSRFHLDVQQDYLCTGYRNIARYYESIKDSIKSQLILRNESTDLQHLSNTIQQQQKNGIQTVSIHIRWWDYIKLGMVVCDIQYYQRALKEIQKTIEKDNLHLYIFCDDPDHLPIDISLFDEYTTTRIIFDDYYIAQWIDQHWFDDVEKFILMSRCQHHIIANSTYSRRWAWLGSNSSITIAPKLWLSKVSSEHIVPDTWLRV